MYVGEHTTRGDCDLAQQLAQLLVIANSQLNVTGHNPGLLVVPGCIASQLQDLSREVLQDCCQVDWGTSSDPGGVLALLQVSCNTSDRKLQGTMGFSRRPELSGYFDGITCSAEDLASLLSTHPTTKACRKNSSYRGKSFVTWSPAFDDLLTDFLPAAFPLPRPDILKLCAISVQRDCE